MKIRTDFITNSSSSSFVILTKEALTKVQLKNELLKGFSFSCDNSIFPTLGERIADILVEYAEDVDIHEFIDMYTSAESMIELKHSGAMGEAVYNNYTEYPYIMVGAVSNDGDDPLENFLVEEDICFKNDKLVIAKNGGY